MGNKNNKKIISKRQAARLQKERLKIVRASKLMKKKMVVAPENQPTDSAAESSNVVPDQLNLWQSGPGQSELGQTEPGQTLQTTSNVLSTQTISTAEVPQTNIPKPKLSRKRKPEINLEILHEARVLRPKKPVEKVMFVSPADLEDDDSDVSTSNLMIDYKADFPDDDVLSTASVRDNLKEYPETETIANTLTSERIEGHRIVDMNYLFNELVRISSHASSLECGIKTMKLISEDHCGLASIFKFKCQLCKQHFKIGNSKKKVNKAAVAGAIAEGQSLEHLNSFLKRLELPTLTDSLYKTVYAQVSSESGSFLPDEAIQNTVKEEIVLKQEPEEEEYDIEISYHV